MSERASERRVCVCAFLPGCSFLATLMGAGGHQVAKTETATFNSTYTTVGELELLSRILTLFHDPLMIMVIKLCLTFMTFPLFLCNYEVARSHDLSFLVASLIIRYVFVIGCDQILCAILNVQLHALFLFTKQPVYPCVTPC